MADETNKKEKKPLMQRLKYAILVSAILFFIGGFIFPILYSASFSLSDFLIGGVFSVFLMWVSIILGHYFMQI